MHKIITLRPDYHYANTEALQDFVMEHRDAIPQGRIFDTSYQLPQGGGR